MNKRLTLILFGICALCACSNDEVSSRSNQVQVLDESCQPSEYVPSCIDDTQRKLCTVDGKVVIEICPENIQCQKGYCSSGSTLPVEDCSGVGCACNSVIYRNTCDGTKRIACDAGVITEHDCADDGFLCFRGECYVKPDTTCSADYQDKCIGNSLYYCSKYDNTISTIECDDSERSDVCATVDHITDCYRKCDTEGEVYYDCMSDTYDSKEDSAEKYTCTKTDKGLLWVPSEVTCHECYTVKPGGYIEENEEFDNVCTKDKCGDDGESSCSNNHAVNCIDGYELNYDCGDHECVIDEELGAICADTCTSEEVDTTKYVCQLESDRWNGFISTSYICKKIGDKYYWIYDDTDSCYHGCNETTGECSKIHPDEGLNCSVDSEDDNYYAEKCENNLILSCEFGRVNVRNCGNKTCLNSENHGYECYDMCTAEETGNPSDVCENGYYSPDGELISNTSIHFSCEEVEPGKFVKHNEYEYCYNGCDNQTGKCKKLHDDEGKPCMPEMNHYCSGEFLLYCEDGITRAVSCKNEKDSPDAVCMEIPNNSYGPSDELYAQCVLSCTEEDLNKPVKECNGNNLYSVECKSNGKGEYYIDEGDGYYYGSSDYEYCEHGCDDIKKECIKLHEDEGELCDPNVDKTSKCVDSKILLECNHAETDPTTGEYIYRYAAADCTKSSSDFEAASCIEINTDQYHYMLGCAATCTAEELGNSTVTCGSDSSYREGWVCVQFADLDIYYWSRVNEYCDQGCDETTNSCVKLHEDEGKICNPDEVESICADEFILSCDEAEYDPVKGDYNYRYNAYLSCTSLHATSEEGMPEFDNYTCVNYTDFIEVAGGELVEKQFADCLPECTAEDVSNSQFSCDRYHLTGWECIQSGEKYYWNIIDEFCDNGCNEEGTACIVYSEYEGTACNYDTDDFRCDDNVLLICNFDNQWHVSQVCVDMEKCVDTGEAGCSNACSAAEENSEFPVCSSYSENTLEYYKCSYDEFYEDYRWLSNRLINCEHGCDAEKNACLKIHEDEYDACSTDSTDDNYYPTQCDGSLMVGCFGYNFYSDLYVIAEDCGDAEHCKDGYGCIIHEDEGNTCDTNYASKCESNIWLYCDEDIVSAYYCDNECDPEFGCYHPCDAPGETSYYCFDYEDDYSYEVTGICVHDDEYNINWVNFNSDDEPCVYGTKCDPILHRCNAIY